jgi:hypothetical protein
MALTALAGDVHITVCVLFSSTTSTLLRVVVVATSASSVVVVLDTRTAAHRRSLRAVVAFRCPRVVLALVEADVVVCRVVNIIVARRRRSVPCARASSCVAPTVRA